MLWTGARGQINFFTQTYPPLWDGVPQDFLHENTYVLSSPQRLELNQHVGQRGF